MFFVLSGFLMTQIVLSQRSANRVESLLQTLGRRFARLLPGLVLCVLVTAVATAAFVPDAKDPLKTGKNALFGASNIRLFDRARDYFGSDSALDPFTHTWSLSVEWQFYLLFLPFSFLLFSTRKRLALASLIGGSVSIIIFFILHDSTPEAAFYLPFSRFWEFAAGALVACIVVHRSWSKPVVDAMHATIVVLVAAALASNDQSGVWNILTVVAGTAALLLTSKERSWLTSILTIPSFRWVGEISYSLYLWHWPVIVLAIWLDIFEPATWLPLLICIFILSITSHYFIEKPVRAISRRKSPYFVLMAGSGIIIASSIAMTTVPIHDLYLRNYKPVSLSPVHDRLECHLPGGESPMSACLTRDPSEQRHLFLVGDSHAGNLVPSLEQVSKEYGFTLRYLTGRALANDLLRDTGCNGATCPENEAKARLEFLINEVRPDDIVVISIARDRLYSESFQGKARSPIDSQIKKDNLSRNLESWAEQLGESGVQFLLVDDIPKLCSKKDFAISHATGAFDRCTVSRSVSRDDRQVLTDAMEGAKEAGAIYLDPHDSLCDGERCMVVDPGGVPMYSDASPHFSIRTSTPLVDFFKSSYFKDLES